ncbi:MAG: hypothetical protein DRJ65_10765 [Acidobacteria bacterium]|nr:MAG: hypothetical protein DRJ65_10765 [Acidobacteriota bacterium]
MEVEYRNTLADVFRFNMYVLPRQRALQILGAAISLFLGHTIWSTVRHTDESLAMKIAVLIVLLSIILGIIGVITFAFTILSVVLNRSRHIIGGHRLVLHEEGIVETTSLGHHETKWQGVYRVVRKKKMLMLFITPISAHLVPTTAFESPAELDRFTDYATQKASDA